MEESLGCGAGYRKGESGGCVQCESNQFSDKFNHSDKCEWCTHCKRMEIAIKNCTRTANTECACVSSTHIYHPHKPCKPCPKGTHVRNNACKKPRVPPAKTRKHTPLADNTLAIAMGVVLAMIIVVLVVVIVLFVKTHRNRNRRRRRRPSDQDDPPDMCPDILHPCLAQQQAVLQTWTKTPPLPEKQKQYSRHPAGDNYYGPAPNATPTPLRPTPLRPRDLKFSLVHELEELLSAAHPRNYKDLAGVLNYDLVFVRNLGQQENPVEGLLEDYVTRPNPTKESLHEAILAIKRYDVAEVFWNDCQPKKPLTATT